MVKTYSKEGVLNTNKRITRLTQQWLSENEFTKEQWLHNDFAKLKHYLMLKLTWEQAKGFDTIDRKYKGQDTYFGYLIMYLKSEFQKLKDGDIIKNPYDIPVMDEETYLSINGASRQSIGDSALHKNRGNNSDKTWKKIIDAQADKDRKLLERREELRKEYYKKIDDGELRMPTRNETLIETANGNPDNAAVLAARRILEKRGIPWKKMNDGDIVDGSNPIYEWWFKDALNKKEMKLQKQYGVTQTMIDFYEGRLYKKLVFSPTTHNDWIPISDADKILGGGEDRRFNKDGVRNIILNEGLLYAIESYMDSDGISYSESDLIKYWDNAQILIRSFRRFMQSKGFEPAHLIHNDEVGFAIIVDPPYREVAINTLSPETQDKVREISGVLNNIINYVGLDQNDFGDKFEDGGELGSSIKYLEKSGKGYGITSRFFGGWNVEQNRQSIGKLNDDEIIALAKKEGYEKKADGGTIEPTEFITENVEAVKGFISTWNKGGGEYEGKPVVYYIQKNESTNSYVINSGVLVDNEILLGTSAFDDDMANESDALEIAKGLAEDENFYADGGIIGLKGNNATHGVKFEVVEFGIEESSKEEIPVTVDVKFQYDKSGNYRNGWYKLNFLITSKHIELVDVITYTVKGAKGYSADYGDVDKKDIIEALEFNINMPKNFTTKVIELIESELSKGSKVLTLEVHQDLVDDVKSLCNKELGEENFSYSKMQSTIPDHIKFFFRTESDKNKIEAEYKVLFKNKFGEDLTDEELIGGFADGLSLEEISEMHHVESDVIKRQAKLGYRIEMEHTKDEDKVKEIVKDHLYENPYYYTMLTQMESSYERMKEDNYKNWVSVDNSFDLPKLKKFLLDKNITYVEIPTEDKDATRIAVATLENLEDVFVWLSKEAGVVRGGQEKDAIKDEVEPVQVTVEEVVDKEPVELEPVVEKGIVFNLEQSQEALDRFNNTPLIDASRSDQAPQVLAEVFVSNNGIVDSNRIHKEISEMPYISKESFLNALEDLILNGYITLHTVSLDSDGNFYAWKDSEEAVDNFNKFSSYISKLNREIIVNNGELIAQ